MSATRNLAGFVRIAALTAIFVIGTLPGTAVSGAYKVAAAAALPHPCDGDHCGERWSPEPCRSDEGNATACDLAGPAAPDPRVYRLPFPSSPGGAESRATSSSPSIHLDALLSVWGRSIPLMACYDCNVCGLFRNKHEVGGHPPPWGGYEASHPERCNGDGSCADHDDCTSSAMATTLQQIGYATRTADAESLAAVVDRHRAWLRVNRSRQSLQLIGCGGAIVANYPVTTVPALEALFQ